MDAIQYNQQLDKALAEGGVVDHEFFVKLAEAYGYGAASTVGWVEAKLRVLNLRLVNGKPLSLYDPKNQHQVIVTSTPEFAAWIESSFPGVCV